MTFRGKSVVGSSLINVAAGVLSLAAGFVASVIVARMLGVEGTGIVAFALYIMALTTAVAGLGLPQSALRFVAGGAADESYRPLSSALTKRFAATTGLMAVAILAYALWLYELGDETAAFVWAATTVLFLAYAYSALSLGVAHGLGQSGAVAKRTLVGCLIQPIAIAIGALLAGPAGAILGHALRHVPQALALRNYQATERAPSSPMTPAIRTYARNNWLSGLCVTLNSRLELAILGLSFSIVAVGYYAIGLMLNGLVLQLSALLLVSLVPYLGFLHDQRDHPQLVLAYQRSLRWLGIVLAPICFGGAAIAPVLIPSLFGEEFRPAVAIAEILIVFSFTTSLTSVPMHMLLAHHRSAERLWLSALWNGIFIVLLIAVVPFFGGLGAAWVRGAVSVATFACFLWYCSTRLDVPFVATDIVKIIAAGVLSAAAARFCIYYDPTLIGMGLGVVAGAAVYGASILLLSVLSADEKSLIAEWILHRLPTRRGDVRGTGADLEPGELQVERSQ
jgi:O-antigen/teichoic acid export membrane protein